MKHMYSGRERAVTVIGLLGLVPSGSVAGDIKDMEPIVPTRLCDFTKV